MKLNDSPTYSYWEKQTFFQYDVIVIGSGIVGLSAAIRLKEKAPKLHIALLERGFLPSGASTKNAGFACFGSISELVEQEKIAGTSALLSLVEKRWKGLLKLRGLLGDAAIGFESKGGYEVFTTGEAVLGEACMAKMDYFNKLLKPIFKKEKIFSLEQAKVGEFGLGGVKYLISNQLEGQLDTGKMMKALLQKASALGILVFNNCEVKEVDARSNNVSIQTCHGSIGCKKVLFATNAFSKKFFPNEDIIPGRGQVLVTKPLKNLRLKGAFHYDKGYYYFRDIDNRVLLGGGRNLDFRAEETTAFGLTDIVQDKLENLLKEVILPDVDFEIEQRWSGIMAFGSKLSPIVKEVQPHIFCAIRGSGMGIAIGSDTGESAADLMLQSIGAM